MNRTMNGISATGDALLAGGTATAPQTFTGFNEFDELTKYNITRPQLVADGTTTNPTDYEFITKTDGDSLYGSITNNAQLDGGVSSNEPQTFTGFNEFEKDIVFEGAITQKDTGSANLITQTATGSTINIFSQSGVNSVASTNSITQVGSNSTFNTDGTIQANGDITSLELRGTTAQDGELLQFINGTGNYPRFVIKGADDAASAISVQLGRHGSSGNGYLRCANNGSSANGIFLLGNGNSYFSGGQLKVAPASTSHGTAKFLVGGGPVVINSYCYANAFVNTSDDRIKENKKLIINATETLLKLTPQIYDKYDDMDLSGNPRVESGLIAQEVYYNAPQLRHLVDVGLTTDASGNEISPTPDEMDLSGVDIGSDPDYGSHGWGKNHSASLDYEGFIPYLIKSNQELHQRISILEAKVNNM